MQFLIFNFIFSENIFIMDLMLPKRRETFLININLEIITFYFDFTRLTIY